MCSFLLLLPSKWKKVRLASTGSYASSSQSLWCSSARLVGSHFSEVQVQVHSCLSLCWKESALASIHSRWSSAFLSWCFPSLLHGCCWQVTWNLQVQSGKVLLASVVQKYWLAVEEIFSMVWFTLFVFDCFFSDHLGLWVCGWPLHHSLWDSDETYLIISSVIKLS